MPRKVVSLPLNAVLAALIKKLGQDPKLAQHQIAAQLGINQGRVSEVLTGKKFAEVKPLE